MLPWHGDRYSRLGPSSEQSTTQHRLHLLRFCRTSHHHPFIFIMSSFWNGPTPAASNGEFALDRLPQHENQYHKNQDDIGAAPDGTADGQRDGSQRLTSKIKCLDGLRGVACFLVFNYHFLWPWTPLIMLGCGARPPKSPEPFTDWTQLPIVCLLHRGRPMVAIFFAISGYVLCRHIQTAIHQRRLDEAYRKLGSAVFRRLFRLYLPCTVSMFAVAVLAQLGAFRTEKAIFKGPDSAWINGTVTRGFLHNGTCPNNTFAVEGRAGVAAALHLQTPLFLNDTIGDGDQLCLNLTSKLHGPLALYDDVDKPKPKPKQANATTVMKPSTFRDFAEYHHDDPHNPASKSKPAAGGGSSSSSSSSAVGLLSSSGGVNGSNGTHGNFTWIQMGGSWEEHPLVHPHLPKALANFTVVYAQWANPFNFGHMHPRYDPHTWTIPKELRGSMVLYTFLLGTAGVTAKWRLAAAVALAAYALTMGHWDMGVFVGGMVLSEVDLLKTGELSMLSHADRLFASSMRDHGSRAPSTGKGRLLRWTLLLIALYLLSYPDTGAEFTPGFRLLASLTPRWYPPISRWMFYQALGALLLVPCVLRSPTLRALLEGPTAQYLGKISFSFYLVHGPILHSLGFWIMPRLFEQFGRVVGYIVGWFMLLSVALYLAGWFHRKVDSWSMGVGRRLERVMANS